MSRPCTICSLPDQRRRKLERQLMTENNTAVAAASGHSRFALARHRKHMNAAMAAAYFAGPPEERDKAMVAYGTYLQAEVRSLIEEANQLRATAVRERDVRAALKGIDSALKALELYAKLSGQLQGPQHNHLHLHVEVPSREEAIEAARECLEVFAPHMLAAALCPATSVVLPRVSHPAKTAAPNIDKLPDGEQERPLALCCAVRILILTLRPSWAGDRRSRARTKACARQKPSRCR